MTPERPNHAPKPGIANPHEPLLNRRWVLLSGVSMAALLAAKQWAPTAHAQTPAAAAMASVDPATAGFLKFSRTITEKPELSATTATRILQAATAVQAIFAEHVAALNALAEQHTSAKALLAAADAAGLKAQALDIVATWYTGTVTGPKGSQLVAYQQALMYQPVSDGLPVPTYCFKGPLWWTAAPPKV